MILEKLHLENFKLFQNATMSFMRGMNVLIGKNSTGKTAILEALNILINNNYPIIIDNIVPYFSSSNNTVLIEGTFLITENEQELIRRYMIQNKISVKDEMLPTKVVLAKRIIKSGVRVNITVEQKYVNKTQVSSATLQIFQNVLIPKLQHNTFLFLSNLISQMQHAKSMPLQMMQNEPLLPLSQFAQVINDNHNLISQYVKSLFFKTKTSNIDEFNKLKRYFLDALPEFSDIEIEYDPDIAQLNVFQKITGLNKKVPLTNEGLGIQEYFNILLILHYFNDSIIVQDESFIHMHKFLLTNLLVSLGDSDYQMITTSHIGDLIKSLSSNNIIICEKDGFIGSTKNLSEADDIIKVLTDLGYENEEDIKNIKNILSDIANEETK